GGGASREGIPVAAKQNCHTRRRAGCPPPMRCEKGFSHQDPRTSSRGAGILPACTGETPVPHWGAEHLLPQVARRSDPPRPAPGAPCKPVRSWQLQSLEFAEDHVFGVPG